MPRGTERLPKPDQQAVEAVSRHLETGKSFIGRPLRLVFAAMNVRRDIAHGLGVVPDGYEVMFADAEIHATPGVLWTTTLAYLQSNADNAHAIVRFFVLREDPLDA